MKNKINKIILAGASSIFGYEQIKEFMEKYSTSISFVETSTMAEYAKLNNSLVGMLWSSFFVTLRPNFCHRVYATP